MHKRLEKDLMSLAHSILKMKNKDDVFALKELSKEVYEKLSLLAFVEEYVNTTPNSSETKEELISKVENGLELQNFEVEVKEIVTDKVVTEVETVIQEVKEEEVKVEIKVDEIIEQPFDELEELIHSTKEPVKEVAKKVEKKPLTLEEELEDTISVDQMATLFDTPAPKSLNDRLSTNINIGLNDRIVFVKNLFDGSQEDFNRVVSQLNTYATEKEAKKFINKMVKPDYDWSNQEELEARFVEIVERKFA